ncbi:PP2C family protein-serine/threonine phosphatase [Streptomyces sp. MMBL 11-1]|uniref:PP2C family protein-serine/threonine phosphatase n=1 Tax=Streptomyces sp. MMBL 11-1 TaxID=3026420 RepID=UPI00236239FF|nr:PP2C family protein-serine/threonine phosphatase [Streptomyces sp. MMBL 11-1]
MPTFRSAQRLGTRSHQCDATAGRSRRGVSAFTLLDGIGSSEKVRTWTRERAADLASAGVELGDAEAALRRVHAAAGAEPGRDTWGWEELPAAVAVLAVLRQDVLTVAWCGDSRAWHLSPNGELTLLTSDHNRAQERLDEGMAPRPGDRNTVTSYLGWHPMAPLNGGGSAKFGTAQIDGRLGRLVLASDGAYEPLESACDPMTGHLAGATCQQAAQRLASTAIYHARPQHIDNATVLVADLSS